MPYALVLSEPSDRMTRAIGENFFFDNLEFDYKVYLFCYPGTMPNEDLESKLRNVGDKTGKNLFVNIEKLDDSRCDTIKDKFEMSNLPVILITGIYSLASFNDKHHFSAVSVRIDDKKIINSGNLVIECMEMLFNLYIGGQITYLLNQTKNHQHDAVVSYLKKKVIGSLRGIEEKEISISLLLGKFQISTIGQHKSENYI